MYMSIIIIPVVNTTIFLPAILELNDSSSIYYFFLDCQHSGGSGGQVGNCRQWEKELELCPLEERGECHLRQDLIHVCDLLPSVP